MNKKNDNFTPVFGFGGENTLYGNHFTGKSYFKPLVEAGDPPIRMANVTFSPGCRTNWHVHTATKGGGQIIIIVDGEGWYQEAGKAPVSLKPGMVVMFLLTFFVTHLLCGIVHEQPFLAPCFVHEKSYIMPA